MTTRDSEWFRHAQPAASPGPDSRPHSARITTYLVLGLALALVFAPTPVFAWQTLHVERDAMSGEPAPACGLLPTAYAAPTITVAFDAAQADPDAEDLNCTLDQNLEYPQDMPPFIAQYKDLTSTPGYWCVFVCSAWCGPAASDYDPVTEDAMLGATYNHEYSWVFDETIRRYLRLNPQYVQQGYTFLLVRKRAALHETGHQFWLPECGNPCVMNYTRLENQTNSFCQSCVQGITTHGRPGPPL